MALCDNIRQNYFNYNEDHRAQTILELSTIKANSILEMVNVLNSCGADVSYLFKKIEPSKREEITVKDLIDIYTITELDDLTISLDNTIKAIRQIFQDLNHESDCYITW